MIDLYWFRIKGPVNFLYICTTGDLQGDSKDGNRNECSHASKVGVRYEFKAYFTKVYNETVYGAIFEEDR